MKIYERLLFKAMVFTGLCLGSVVCYSEPVSEDQQVPIDLRRTTLVVSDIDQSLALYRDALGMQVIYDKLLNTPADAKTDEELVKSRRLVFLRANDNYIGVLGLLQYFKPEVKPAHQGLVPFTPGSMVLLFNTKQLDQVFDRARNVVGVRILSEPERVEYPGYDGKSVIEVNVSTLVDPDGFTLELNELLSDLK